LPALILVLVLAGLLAPASAAAQACGPGPGGWVGVEAGRVGYDVAGGITGYEWGADAGIGTRSLAARLGYRRVDLEESGVTPHLLRAALRSALPAGGGWRFCLAAHGGGSLFSGDAGEGTVVAGGVGLGIAYDLRVDQVLVVPFVEARGLAARSTGTVLGLDTDATGLSLGVEGGAIAHVGRLHIQATASLDGFAAGLGVTPFPASAIRLGLGYRF
jgi:opacity protein-like surface antigen